MKEVTEILLSLFFHGVISTDGKSINDDVLQKYLSHYSYEKVKILEDILDEYMEQNKKNGPDERAIL